MFTTHTVTYQNANSLSMLGDESIDLVVTSPPYPMIEMWDQQFIQFNTLIGGYLETGDYVRAFEAMHEMLDKVWCELFRVMKNGAFVCINIGDATRTIENRFQLFANHVRIQKKFIEIGFDVLPGIIWRKQTNAPSKFMGSGMLPAGAYVTLEHEHILIFRKGNKRIFASAEEKNKRMQSGYFWEERNTWFSDLWDFKGIRQEINDKELRKRSAAYPVLLPFRLINMYSVFGDTVLDPYLGTGTTVLAALAAGRNSVSCEIDRSFAPLIKKRIAEEYHSLNSYNRQRITKHIDFVENYDLLKGGMKYTNSYFGFPVMTKQEREIQLAFLKAVSEVEKDVFEATYYDSAYIKSLNFKEPTLEILPVGSEVQQTIVF